MVSRICQGREVLEYFLKDKIRLISLILLLAAFLVSDGLYSIDELVYFLPAKALIADAEFTIQNGYEQFRSKQLAMWLLVEGPNGLVPQYPSGSAIAAAPLVAFLGVRGFILMNVLATIGSLYSVRALAIRLFDNTKIASLSVYLLLCATYLLDYSFAIWPHMVAVLCTSSALYWFLRAMQEPDNAGRWAFNAGLWISLGLLFRLDSILLIPAFALVWVSSTGASPWTLLGGVAGLVPGALVSATIAFLKFGTFNPLTYGRSGTTGGGVELSGHASAATLMLILLIVALVIRFRSCGTKNTAYNSPILVGAALLALYGALQSDAFQHTLTGIYSLLIDLTFVGDNRSGIIHLDYGLVSFWGMPKKAFGQSLPWIGLLAAIPASRWRPRDRTSITLIAFVIIVWMLPFITRSWHGGMSSNMRYFLPLLPLVCVIGVRVWYDVLDGSRISRKMLFSLTGLGFTLPAIWMSLMSSGEFGAHQKLSVLMLWGVTTASFTTVIFPSTRQRFLPVTQSCILIAVGAAIFFSLSDLTNSQKRRVGAKQADIAVSSLRGPFLVFTSPELVPSAFYQMPTRLVASRDIKTGEIDLNLARQALEGGRRVFVDSRFKPMSLERTDPDLILRNLGRNFGKFHLLEMEILTD